MYQIVKGNQSLSTGGTNYTKYVLLWKACCRLLYSVGTTVKRPGFFYVTEASVVYAMHVSSDESKNIDYANFMQLTFFRIWQKNIFCIKNSFMLNLTFKVFLIYLSNKSKWICLLKFKNLFYVYLNLSSFSPPPPILFLWLFKT